jgi:glycosyltransferase involved in cell wall biosynthesis
MTRPYRLLLTADAVGGVWTYAADLARELKAFGVHVTLAVLGPPPSEPRQRQLPDGIDVVLTGLDLDWMHPGASGDEAGRRLAEIASETRSDLIHLNSPSLAAETRFPAPVVAGCHSCLSTWWRTVRPAESMPSAFRLATERLGRGYRACDALIAPSRAFADATEVVYGLRPHMVLNGRASPDRTLDCQRRPVALAAGRLWDEAKGARALDQASARMRHAVEAAGPVIGPDGVGLFLNHLTLLGDLDAAALRSRMETTEVFVSPGAYEPFGLSVLEAAQAGCALVLADIPTFRELWSDAAVFVPPNDPAVTAETLDCLLGDIKTCRWLGDRARKRARGYTARRMAEATVAVHQSVLDARARRAAA